jgi:hypothetical protein
METHNVNNLKYPKNQIDRQAETSFQLKVDLHRFQPVGADCVATAKACSVTKCRKIFGTDESFGYALTANKVSSALAQTRETQARWLGIARGLE